MNYPSFFQSIIKLTVFILVIGAVLGMTLGKITGEQYIQIMMAFVTGYFSGRIPTKTDPNQPI
jgi:hypothetical protein